MKCVACKEWVSIWRCYLYVIYCVRDRFDKENV